MTSILGGAPPFYTDPETLQNKIDSYFNGGCRTKIILIGKDKEPMEIPVPTISGLAYFLGFESRQSFYDYEKREGFSYTIKRARLFIEVEYEEQLHSGNVTGAIFALKNMGWIDTRQVDQKTEVKIKGISDDELNDALSDE
jgi:hypothetical protein